MNKRRHCFVAVVTHVLSPGSAGAGVPKLLLGQGNRVTLEETVSVLHSPAMAEEEGSLGPACPMPALQLQS